MPREPVSDYKVRPKPSPSRTVCPRTRLWTCGHRSAFAMLLSQCLPADAPTHTPAALPRPHPALSPPSTRKNRHSPAPPVLWPCPHTHPLALLHVPTSAPFLPANPPQSRHPHLQHTHRRATIAYARDRPRGPESLPPSVGAPLVGALWQRRETAGRPVRPPSPCPLLPRGATLMPQIAHSGITELSGTADAPSYEPNRMQQKRTDFALPPSREQRCWGHLVI